MRAVLIAVLAAMACLGCANSRRVSSELHVLTWENYDGTTAPDQAVYILDGKVIGKGDAAIAKLKSSPFEPGAVVRIQMPWVIEPRGPDFTPPYLETDLLSSLKARGVVVEIEENRTDGAE